MARLVINEDITSGRALTPSQVLQLGDFNMDARSATKPTAAPTIARHHLHISLEHSEKMDPADVSSLNELLDRIAALGVAIDYDRIGLKPDQREIVSPPVTHLVAVIEERAENDSSPKLKTSYVRISESCEPDTPPREETVCPPNTGSCIETGSPQDLPDLELVNSEALQAPNSIMDRDADFSLPTHHNQYSPSNSGPPDICDLMYIQQQP